LLSAQHNPYSLQFYDKFMKLISYLYQTRGIAPA